MSSFDDEAADQQPRELIPDPPESPQESAHGIDRRAFMMRSAMIGAVAVITAATSVDASSAPCAST